MEKYDLSSDKIPPINLLYDHFKNILTGKAFEKEYDSPILLLTGGPGVGKSHLVGCISEIATTCELADPIRIAFMGIAAININGYTINTKWDVPINLVPPYVDRTCPWNPDKLERFKQNIDLDRLSLIIIDEASTLKPWMFAYLDDRLCQAAQKFDKPFAGKAVLIIGDFDQQQPIGGYSLPHLSMIYLKDKYDKQKQQKQHTSSYIYDKLRHQSASEKKECNSLLSKKGVQLFQLARHMTLEQQHRCTNDDRHMNFLKKMSRGDKIQIKDLASYATLSKNDVMADAGFQFAPIIVTGNYERQEINAYQTKQFALQNNTHVFRWPKKVRLASWENKPTSPSDLAKVRQESCLWEYFVSGAPAYLNQNINLSLQLANGTHVKMDSISFETPEEEEQVQNLINSTPIDGIVDLEDRPASINVELYPDFEWDTPTMKEAKKIGRKDWPLPSLFAQTNNRKKRQKLSPKVIIPISKTSNCYQKWAYDSIPAHGGRSQIKASRVQTSNHFPIDIGFAITVPKIQGRTIRREILSLSKHPIPALRCKYEQLYTSMSRITNHNDCRLLLNHNDRSTLGYIANLKKDPYTAYYFAGFGAEVTGEPSSWNETLAARAAGFLPKASNLPTPSSSKHSRDSDNSENEVPQRNKRRKVGIL